MVSKEYFYPGTDSSLEPGTDTTYIGKVAAGKIGGTTSVQTANQVQEVTNLLNTGMKAVELSTIQPEIFDMIPSKHLKEVNRLTKLTGSEVTLHAPMIEPSGFTQQGWSEQNREEAERQLKEVVLRANELSPEKPIPVTIHSSAIPGTEKMPAKLVKGVREEEKRLYGDYIPTQLIAVNQETGEAQALRREEEYYPGMGKKIRTAEERLDILNDSHWINKVTNLAFYKKEADELMDRASQEVYPLIKQIREGKIKATEEDQKKYEEGMQKLNRAGLFLDNVTSSFRTFYDEAYKTGDEKTRKALDEVSKIWKDHTKEMIDLAKKGQSIAIPMVKSDMIDKSLNVLNQMSEKGLTPQLFKPVEQFATEKASETFSNVAVEAYKKFRDKAPIISIENPPYGTAISTAEDLKNLIKETRSKFAEKIQREQNLSENEAKKAAEKMIGATWDTSHISMIRKQGFDKNELVKQADIIAPYVKHVHFNDNLGYTHTDLPPGMGDVPFKEILAKLEKGGSSKDKKFIFEGGNFFQHFKTSPHPYVLEATGSPVYSMVAQPTWTQVYGTTGQYSSGYGPFLPEQNFSIYGGGLSGLPVELGGQMPGKQSRFSGAPMT